MKKEIKVTKQDCIKYESVRRSGVTNMFDVDKVERFSGLEKEKIFYIMNNYDKLNKKYKFRKD